MTRTRAFQFFTTAVLALSLWMPRAAAAQTATTTDVRWNAWIGCWASGPMDAFAASLSRPVCVIPAGGSAVDILSLADGRVVSRERIDANGEQRPSERDGCKGWQSA